MSEVSKPIEQRKWGWLVLFLSSSTLVCCALPILLVGLGLGALSATLFEALPFLVTLSHYKIWMFIISCGALLLAGWALYRPNRACPTDLLLAQKCEQAHRWNLRVWKFSILVWSIGFIATYLSLPVFEWLNS